MSGLPLGTLVSNLKYVALTIFDLLAFNSQKFRESRDPVTPPFGKIFGGHIWTVPGNTFVKFEVRTLTVFELLALNSYRSAARAHTDKQTHERTHYLRQSPRSLGGDN